MPHPGLRKAPCCLLILGLYFKEIWKWAYCSTYIGLNFKYERGCWNAAGRKGHSGWCRTAVCCSDPRADADQPDLRQSLYS